MKSEHTRAAPLALNSHTSSQRYIDAPGSSGDTILNSDRRRQEISIVSPEFPYKNYQSIAAWTSGDVPNDPDVYGLVFFGHGAWQTGFFTGGPNVRGWPKPCD